MENESTPPSPTSPSSIGAAADSRSGQRRRVVCITGAYGAWCGARRRRKLVTIEKAAVLLNRVRFPLRQSMCSPGPSTGMSAHTQLQTARSCGITTQQKPFITVNRVKANGGSLDSAGPTIAGGILFGNSGYDYTAERGQRFDRVLLGATSRRALPFQACRIPVRAAHQKSSFSANWISLGSRAPLTLPNGLLERLPATLLTGTKVVLIEAN